MLSKVEFPGLPHPLWLRPGTTDEDVLRDIFVRKEYSLELSPQTRVIVDAGANIGFASIFFTMRFSGSLVVAIEPDPSNFSLLQQNVAPYSNIIPLQAALWHSDEPLVVIDPGDGHWGLQVCRTTDPNTYPVLAHVDGLCLTTIMHRHQLQYVDLLKVDIEGSERHVFAPTADWIPFVGAVVVEAHDADGDNACSVAVESSLTEFSITKTIEPGYFPKIFAWRPSALTGHSSGGAA